MYFFLYICYLRQFVTDFCDSIAGVSFFWFFGEIVFLRYIFQLFTKPFIMTIHDDSHWYQNLAKFKIPRPDYAVI